MSVKINGFIESKDQSSIFNELLDNSSDFKSVIMKPMILEGLNCNIKEVRQYLSIHLPRLLKTAMKGNTPTSLSAMRILTSFNASKITNLVKTSFFSDFTTDLLSNEKVSTMIVGKLSEISAVLFRSGNKEFLSHAGFVILFLKYLGNCGVCEFFLSLFDNDIKFMPAQNWLFEIGIDLEFASLLKKYLSENNDLSNYNFQEEKLINLLRIINKGLLNYITRPKIIDSPIFSVFLDFYKLPSCVNNFYWQVINNLYESNTKDQLLMYTKEARKNLINPVDKIHMFHNESLNFLKKYMSDYPELIDAELIKSIINLMMQFENCELFLIGAGNFILDLCQSNKLSKKVEKYIPVFINEAANSNKSPFQMVSLAIAKEIATSDSTKDVFRKTNNSQDFVKSTLDPYINILNSRYGFYTEFQNESN